MVHLRCGAWALRFFYRHHLFRPNQNGILFYDGDLRIALQQTACRRKDGGHSENKFRNGAGLRI